MQQEAYTYHNLPIPGGGYATGFIFRDADGVQDERGRLYLRTDIGGMYRFERDAERWVSLTDAVTMEDLSQTFPIAAALDPSHPERLYVACGVNRPGAGQIVVSDDYGAHFRVWSFPILIHGNLNGRGTGLRLIVDKRDSERLYFASQEEGLWTSTDRGAHWTKMPACPETHLTFVGQSKDGHILFIGSAGVACKRGEHLRGTSLYVSYDGGEHFAPLWQPADGPVEGVDLAGLVGERYAWDEKYLYVSYSVMGRDAFVRENGYSCDGGSVIGGRIARFSLENTPAGLCLGDGEDITPPNPCPDGGTGGSLPVSFLEYGFSGIDASRTEPGLVVCSTISRADGDCIYRSRDYGQTWECILHDLDTGRMDFRTSYMKPCYNGGYNIIHWLTDLKIDPLHSAEAWFNTGTGVFRTRNLLDETVVFSDWCDGLEETVHLNLYSPPAGDVQLIDILGDLGGFAFRDLDKPCDNSFDDADGNRYITCINADFSDLHPELVVVTPRGNWKGKTKGGLIYSKDQCRTFRRLPMPFGLSERLDRALSAIETPNVNSGWAALSPDGKRVVWSVAEGITLPTENVLVSGDGGETFQRAEVIDRTGQQKKDGGLKVFSDRLDSDLFYGFGEKGDIYVSTDGGCHFREIIPSGDAFPMVDCARIDCANKTEIRGECGKSGVFYLALGAHGLWKLLYDKTKNDMRVIKLSRPNDIVYRIGLGVGRPGGDYAAEQKALYVSAVIDGEYGFYRSADEGQSFVRLNTAEQMFGEINSMEGDSRVYGRFYVGTGSRGVLYGERR